MVLRIICVEDMRIHIQTCEGKMQFYCHIVIFIHHCDTFEPSFSFPQFISFIFIIFGFLLQCKEWKLDGRILKIAAMQSINSNKLSLIGSTLKILNKSSSSTKRLKITPSSILDIPLLAFFIIFFPFMVKGHFTLLIFTFWL